MAKRKVMAENAARGQEKQDQIVADVGPTIVKNLILGGGILGTLDAATIPRQGGEVLLVSMPAPSDRPVMQTDGSIIASNTRQQRMDPWSTYGDLEIGQTGYQLLPYNADVNGHPILGHDGKPIPDPGLLGMTIQPWLQLRRHGSQASHSFSACRSATSNLHPTIRLRQLRAGL
jgi:hypothetical protein